MKRLITLAVLAAACGAPESAIDVTVTTDTPTSEVAAAQTTSVLQPQLETLAPQSEATKTLRELYAQADFYEARFAESRSWLDAERAAAVRRGIARLNGNVAEYVAVQQLLDDAFSAAAEGSGPFFERASFHMTIHQIDAAHTDVEQYATRLILQDDAQAAVQGLRGDVAFHRGDLTTAGALYLEAEELHPTAASAGRLGYLALSTGDYDEAARLYAVASERVSTIDPGAKAWAELHRGIVELERGDVAAALPFYEAAENHFSGWYLVQEHIAEAYLLLGEPDRALEIYRDVLERVPNGEFYAALAETYDVLGDETRATVARANAHDAFERDIALVESAASGHALDFYIGDAPAQALELAEQNFATRPNHEARTKLAQARFLNGDRPGAVDILLPTTETDWATVEFMATAAVVLRNAQPELAATYAERAERVIAGSVTEMEDLLAL